MKNGGNVGVERIINNRLKTLENWSKRWRLRFAPTKTKYLIFSRNKTGSKNECFNLKIYGQPILKEEQNDPKFLGIRFDKQLSFRNQVSYLKKTCDDRLNILKVLSNKWWGLEKNTLVILYKSLIRSILDYSLFMYPVISPKHQKSLQAVQNNALRIISGEYQLSSSELHRSFNIDRLDARSRELTSRYLLGCFSHNNELITELISNYSEFKNKSEYNQLKPNPKFAITKTLLDSFIQLDEEENISSVEEEDLATTTF
jgi:hypothetical protein